MFERTRPIRDEVTFRFERRTIAAERGEPLAVSLLAAGETALARSPKLHRPRGAFCLRGDCDGCLLRVDGVPNVMSCLEPARGGEVLSVQNVIGGRNTDLLRLTDWFFPQGIDHHHLLAGVPAVGSLMQSFARQLAGVGRLPDHQRAPQPAARRELEVLVVGGGASGLGCACELARQGRDVVLLDEASALGGSALLAAPERVAKLAGDLGTRARIGASAVAVHQGQVLSVTRDGSELYVPRALVLATGAHATPPLVSGNDLPGVMSVRAVLELATRGIVPTRPAVIAGEGSLADQLERTLGSRLLQRVAASDLVAFRGGTQVKAVVLASGDELRCQVVACALPPAPAFELGVQAGGRATRQGGGYPLEVDAEGRAGPRLYAVGECTGASFEPESLIAAGERAARAVMHDLAGGR